MAGVTPVFILNNQLPAFDEKNFTPAEICAAVEKTSGYETIEGAQRIGGLWRMYPRSSEERLILLLQGLAIRHVRVEVKDRNPFVVTTADGEREIEATKLIINNVPLSYSDEDILKTIKKLDVNIRSKLIHERDRDSNGKLTRWKTGRRFLYIDIPAKPLPKQVEMGPFKASIYHKEQKRMDKECGKCLQKGHQAADCPNVIKCHQCYKDGHKAGDPQCHMRPTSEWENDWGSGWDSSTEAGSNQAGQGSVEDGGKAPVERSSRSNSKDKKKDRNLDAVKTACSKPQSNTPKAGIRGRQPQRSRPKESNGQTVLTFRRRDASGSASQKRPKSSDRSPPQPGHEKHQRRDASQARGLESSGDEYSGGWGEVNVWSLRLTSDTDLAMDMDFEFWFLILTCCNDYWFEKTKHNLCESEWIVYGYYH
ncbi:hypothetical protein ACOMHN_033697 [Nucella lapillus]